ncbi:MAG: DJ-1/PfpI family protein [Anaerohalosphaeraceae bacterium]|nr:DJ-1/PfpI family protein [Anaerohalosphaeraceae bacterium]
MSNKVLVPIASGTEEIEAVCIVDILRRAGADATVASVGDIQITASRGVKIVADCVLADCAGRTYDMIVLPGGLDGADNLANCSELIKMLKAQKESGRFYAAICASPAVVFETHGLLKGKKATCYPSMASQLSDSSVADERVVVDGNCITSQGPAAAFDFALKLVELLFGPEKAEKIAAGLLMK